MPQSWGAAPPVNHTHCACTPFSLCVPLCYTHCACPLATGVPEDERYEGDDLEVLARAEEAEEAAFGDEEVRKRAGASVPGNTA